jgi:hypothetical protein
VQLDPAKAKAGIVPYGLNLRLPTYGQPDPLQPQRAVAPAGTHCVVYTFELSFSAAAANPFVCTSHTTRGARWGVAFVAESPSLSTARPKTAHVGEEQTRNAILEMRPARASLRDKAREETSEFEREYPW